MRLRVLWPNVLVLFSFLIVGASPAMGQLTRRLLQTIYRTDGSMVRGILEYSWLNPNTNEWEFVFEDDQGKWVTVSRRMISDRTFVSLLNEQRIRIQGNQPISALGVRNAMWGDSIKKVMDSEKTLKFKREDSQTNPDEVFLVSNEQEDICGEKATIHFEFFRDKLIRVTYYIDISKTNNPFEHDTNIRRLLIEKYGEQAMERYLTTFRGITVESTTETQGLKGDAWDTSETCSRKSKWIFPSHTIELLAVSLRNRGEPDSRMVRLDYQSTESAMLDDRKERARNEEGEKRRNMERSKL